MMKNTQWQELGKISREVMELLRTQPTCTMPVSKFIPAYHHHFGHQCRVADYGYNKLQDLFESIPHAIQVNRSYLSLLLTILIFHYFLFVTLTMLLLLWGTCFNKLVRAAEF